MGPALSPGAVAQEMAACAVLGGVLGAARAVLPTRGRAAFLPDMLFVGVALMALQSYAVSQSQAGQLRGYMALAAFCAAGAGSSSPPLIPAAVWGSSPCRRRWTATRGGSLWKRRTIPSG